MNVALTDFRNLSDAQKAIIAKHDKAHFARGRKIPLWQDWITLPDPEKVVLVEWCREAFRSENPTRRLKRVYSRTTSGFTSYGLKHRFEEANGGFYIDNEQFKVAMLLAGFEPKRPQELNWEWRIWFSEGWAFARRGYGFPATFGRLTSLGSRHSLWFREEVGGSPMTLTMTLTLREATRCAVCETAIRRPISQFGPADAPMCLPCYLDKSARDAARFAGLAGWVSWAISPQLATDEMVAPESLVAECLPWLMGHGVTEADYPGDDDWSSVSILMAHALGNLLFEAQESLKGVSVEVDCPRSLWRAVRRAVRIDAVLHAREVAAEAATFPSPEVSR